MPWYWPWGNSKVEPVKPEPRVDKQEIYDSKVKLACAAIELARDKAIADITAATQALKDDLLNLKPAPVEAPVEKPVSPHVPDADEDDVPRLIVQDSRLAPNFSLYELTSTSYLDFLKKNRIMTLVEVGKLKEVAEMLQIVRDKFGKVLVHSGRRSPALNAHIGGSKYSQHMKCEAADFHVRGYLEALKMEKVFRWIWHESEIPFGQLILESARKRGYGVVRWIHLSLGAPYRPAGKCGEVLLFNNGKYRRLN